MKTEAQEDEEQLQEMFPDFSAEFVDIIEVHMFGYYFYNFHFTTEHVYTLNI